MGIWNIVYLVVDNYCIYKKKYILKSWKFEGPKWIFTNKNFGLHVTIFFLLQAPKFFISCAFFFPFPFSSVLLSSQADHTPFQALAHHHLLLPHLHVQAAAAASGRSRSNSGELLQWAQRTQFSGEFWGEIRWHCVAWSLGSINPKVNQLNSLLINSYFVDFS